MTQALERRYIRASDLRGNLVVNTDGEELGTVTEFIIDTESGRIAYAVLSFGGFLGVGDKLFALPWSSLQLHQTDHSFILHADKAVLAAAPGFDKNNWPDFTDRTWGSAIYGYYQIKPYW